MRGFKILALWAGIVAAALTFSVKAADVSLTTVSPGEWSSDFNATKSYADNYGYPMLVFWASPGCAYCSKMKKAVSTSTFLDWSKNKGILMVFSEGDTTVKSFTKNSSGNYPYMRLYWPAGNVDLKFTGRSGQMGDGNTLEAQLISLLEWGLEGWKGAPSKPVESGKYVFHFDANGGSNWMASYTCAVGTEAKLPSNVLTREGYAFKGWSLDPNGEVQLADSASLKIDKAGSVTLYAVWERKSEVSPQVQDGVLTVPAKTKEIAEGAYAGIDYIKKVVLPSSLKKIGENAFAGCENLKYVEGLYPTVEVAENAFANTPYADGWKAPLLEIVDGVLTQLVWEVRHDDGCITNGVLNIPEGVVEISESVFAEQALLSTVSLPKSLKRIGRQAFWGCSFLEKVNGGENLEWVGEGAFADTPFLNGWDYILGFDTEDAARAYYTYMEPVYVGDFIVGVYGGLAQAYDDEYYDANGNWTWDCPVVIEDGTTGLADFCFGEQPPFTSVKIPGSIRRIPDSLFRSSPLFEVVLGEGIERIGVSAFEGTRLTYVDLPESMRFVGAYAFADTVDGIQSVTFRSLLTQFDSSAFEWFDPEQQKYRVDPALTEIVMANNREGYHLANWKVELHGDDTRPEYYDLPEKYQGKQSDPSKCGLYPADGLKAFDTSYLDGVLWTYLVTPVEGGNQYVVEFDANGGSGEMSAATFTYDVPQALPACQFVRTGYDFKGWSPSPYGEVLLTDGEEIKNLLTEGRTTAYAIWARSALWTLVPDGDAGPILEAASATVYDAYVQGVNDYTEGKMEIKVGAGKVKNGVKSAVVSMSLAMFGQKTETVKGSVVLEGGDGAGVFSGTTKAGQRFSLRLGANGVSGTIGTNAVEGVVNQFVSKDPAAKAKAAEVLDERKGVYSVAFETGWGWNVFSIDVGAKGKCKVTGVLVDGTKISTRTQLMMAGNGVCSVAVVYSKNELAFAYNLWLSDQGIAVSGIEGALVGRIGTLSAPATFRVDPYDLVDLIGDYTFAEYFPNGLSVEFDGKKFSVAGGARAGKVVLNKEKTAVDAAKAGANPAGLKLSYTAKTGIFKGAFKAYTYTDGKPKPMSLAVSGVLIDGVGYGAALIKKVGAVPIEIR